MASDVIINAIDVVFVQRFARFKILKWLMAVLYGSTIVNNVLHACNGVQKRQYSSVVKHRTGKDITIPM